MKALLGRLTPRRAVGIYLGEDEIALCQVAATVVGPVEICRTQRKYQGEDLASVLKEMLEPIVGARRRRRRLVGFSLPVLRVFFSTRPFKATNVEVSSKVLLHEVLQSPNSSVEDMAIDRMDGSPGKRPVVSLASCRKKYLTGLLASMQGCDIRPYRVEPTPCALLRAAEQMHRAPRKAKTVLRIFLGARDGLALLTANGWPLVPRPFDIEDDVAATITSNARTLDALGKLCGTDAAIDTILVHGRKDLAAQVDLESLEAQLGARIQWHEEPGFDSGAIAYGVALGCVQMKPRDFDLARSLKQRESIWEIFPWAELAMQLVVIVCLALFLFNRRQELNTKYAAVRSETEGRHWMTSMSDPQLVKEKQDLEQRVEAIRKFLATRVVWTEYTHDIPEKLPENARLNSFHGICELEKKARKDVSIKPKKTFTMRIGVPIASDGAVPKEVDGFLDALRDHALLKRDFPLVELADIKWFQPFIGAQPTAFFTVVCLPKTTAPGEAAPGGKK